MPHSKIELQEGTPFNFMKTINGLLLAGLLATVGCSSAPELRRKTANVDRGKMTSNDGNATIHQRQVKLPAQTVAPDTIVKDLYKQHDAQKSPFFQTKNRALVDKYFDKNLAD